MEIGLVCLKELRDSRIMDERPPPSMKHFIFPACFATLLAGAIVFFAPELGFFAWFSAWIGSFFVLSVWGVVTR